MPSTVKGFQPKALLDKAQRDNDIAEQEMRIRPDSASAASRLSLKLPATARSSGDSYNDRPRSAQRADERKQAVFDLSAQLSEKQAALHQLGNDVGRRADTTGRHTPARPCMAPASGARSGKF